MSATIAGLITLPGSLASAIVSPFAGRIYDKLGMRVLFVTGAIGLLISNGLMIFVTIDTGLWVALVLNIVRNVSTAFMLMPLVTWGASTVSLPMTSHATALLTSLRTIAGSLGTAIFVAVMTIASVNYGADTLVPSLSSMHGVNMAFLGMLISDIVLVVLALWGTRKNRKPQEQIV